MYLRAIRLTIANGTYLDEFNYVFYLWSGIDG